MSAPSPSQESEEYITWEWLQKIKNNGTLYFLKTLAELMTKGREGDDEDFAERRKGSSFLGKDELDRLMSFLRKMSDTQEPPGNTAGGLVHIGVGGALVSQSKLEKLVGEAIDREYELWLLGHQDKETFSAEEERMIRRSNIAHRMKDLFFALDVWSRGTLSIRSDKPTDIIDIETEKRGGPLAGLFMNAGQDMAQAAEKSKDGELYALHVSPIMSICKISEFEKATVRELMESFFREFDMGINPNVVDKLMLADRMPQRKDLGHGR